MDAFDRTTQGRSPQAEVLEPGFKYNLTDIAAVLGLGQLERLDGFNEARRLAQHYLELLAEIEEILPLAVPPYAMRHAWHLFIVRLDTERAGMSRDTFMADLKERNIGTGLHFKAVHPRNITARPWHLPPGALPATEWNSERICSLPLFPAHDHGGRGDGGRGDQGGAGMKVPEISVVIPVFNEKDNLVGTDRPLSWHACRSLGRPFELILVDDGSVTVPPDDLPGRRP